VATISRARRIRCREARRRGRRISAPSRRKNEWRNRKLKEWRIYEVKVVLVGEVGEGGEIEGAGVL